MDEDSDRLVNVNDNTNGEDNLVIFDDSDNTLSSYNTAAADFLTNINTSDNNKININNRNNNNINNNKSEVLLEEVDRTGFEGKTKFGGSIRRKL